MPGEPAALHLPADRAQAILVGNELGTATGSVLLADLGGFTVLTKSLVAAQGSRKGAEMLINHLNSVYDTIIDEVHRYGGVVVDFSGDAVNCFFGPNSGHDPAARAVTAALGMQRRLKWHQSVDFDISEFSEVSLKVGIATGSVQRLRVGNPDIRLFDVMTGLPVFGASRLEQLAESGRVVVDGTTIRHLEQSNCGVDISTSHPDVSHQDAFVVKDLAVMAGASRIPVTDLARNAAAEWVDYQLRSDSGARSAELRSVVTLFVQFWRPDHDAQQDIEVGNLEESVRNIQALVDRHGGSLIQVTVGDKGGYGFCVFGAPVAHKELSDRALACSLDLRAALGATSAEWAIGIAQGVCRAGYYGSKTRRSYGVIGDCVNVAARLMTAGEAGQILVTDRVQSSWKRAVVCEPQQLMTLAGQPEPVAVSAVVGYRIAGDDGRVFGDLTGRSAALVELATHLDQVLEGTADVIIVTADPGIGKSHLIEAARIDCLERSNVHWFALFAEQANPRPMHPFLSLLERIFYQELGEDHEVRRQLFEASFDGFIYEVREFTQSLADELSQCRDSLGMLLAQGFGTSALSIGEATGLVILMIRGVAATRPLVLHIQDAQWMDLGSKTVLKSLLAADVDRVCVLIDTTPDLEMGLDSPSRRVDLAPLDWGEVETFAATQLEGDVAPSIVHYLVRLTAGNPLYMEHVLAALQHRHEIHVDGQGRWQLDDEPVETLPESLTPILTARLDRLPVAVRETVQLASVLGQTFEVEHLRAMSDEKDRADLDELVARAGEHGIWSCDSGSCTFTTGLIREAAQGLYLDSDARSHELLAARSDRTRVQLDKREKAVSLTIASSAGSEKQAMDVVAQMAITANVSPSRIEDLRTAVSEACINAIRHGNQLTENSSVRVDVLVDDGTMVIDVVDENRMQLDVGSIVVAVPDIEAQIAGRQTPGGMGLYLISRLVDSAGFIEEPEAVGTRFRMVFDLGVTQ